MNKIIFGILALASTTLSASASDFCIAQKDHQVGYGSTMKYRVKCSDNSEYTSPQIITAFLIPIPYQWGKVARGKLSTMMQEKGYSQVSQINEVPVSDWRNAAFEDSLLVFGKVNTGGIYCAALESNRQTIGADQKRDIYDYSVSCNQKNIAENLAGLTRTELGAYMKKIGVKFSFYAKPVKGFKEDFIFVFEGI